MRAFAEAWPDREFVQQVIAQLPWGHQTRLLDRLKDRPTRLWYLKAAVEHGWSQNVLVHHISTSLHQRQGKALTNFSRTLPPEGSDLTEQVLKDPYQFDFLTLAPAAKERELEHGLLAHLRDLLLELGRGFAFVGSQVPFEVDGQVFYVDLLFYHVRLHCYFVIELKVGPFKPEYAGNLNFYLSAADDSLRTASDSPTLGLLCARVVADLLSNTPCAMLRSRLRFRRTVSPGNCRSLYVRRSPQAAHAGDRSAETRYAQGRSRGATPCEHQDHGRRVGADDRGERPERNELPDDGDSRWMGTSRSKRWRRKAGRPWKR
jgi:predicted nuclease of restriction endonuclease-like (RecB) superfamily